MRIGQWRAASATAPVAQAETLIGPGGLVVIAPHPDDESLGASALLVGAAQAMRPVGLVALTDGEHSHRNSTAFPAESLAAIRRAEQAAAMAALGCGTANILRLGLPDGTSGQSLDLAAAAERIARFCDAIGASALASTLPFDPHPDHETAGRLAEAVRRLRPRLRLLFYPVWSLKLADDFEIGTDGLHPFRLATPLTLKAAAIDRHASQLGDVVTDDPDGFVLPEEFLAHHSRPFEEIAWAAMPGSPPDASHFAEIYAGGADPWNVRSSHYEAAKRETALEALGATDVATTIEIGCGEGHLTARLAAISRRTIGVDLDPSIVERARRAHAGVAGLSFAVARMPDAFPDAPFDRLVLSEVLYFLDEMRIARLLARATPLASEGARILLVDYLGDTAAPLSGEDAADFFIACAAGWTHDCTQRHDGFRLDLLTRTGATP